MKKTKILLSGVIDYDPIGRHGFSFLNTLRHDPHNEIWLDSDYMPRSRYVKDIGEPEELNFTEDAIEEFDFLIYFHVLGIDLLDRWYAKAASKKAKIKICYPVFDGTVPPLEWIDEINANFDICLSPSEYVAHNLRRYGVTIDCFGLECCVLIEHLLKCRVKKTENFRFGCVSGNDERKNLVFLIECFAETFSKDEHVELFIHSVERPDLLTPFNELENAVEEAAKRSNVILHRGFVSQQQMDAIWETFNAYIIPQKSTGYFTTPLEGLACGVPVILSDIPVHRELLKYVRTERNLFFASHPYYTPEFHFVFDYRNIGVSFSSSHGAYKKILREVYEKRDTLYSDNLISERKEAASLFLPEKLFSKYNWIIHPLRIAHARSVSHVDTEGTFFMSDTLAEKYESFGFGKKYNLEDTYVATNYPEEASPVFQAIEKTAVASQRLYLMKRAKSVDTFVRSKYFEKIKQKAEKYHIKKFPFIAYKFASFCFKVKYFFSSFEKRH